MADFLAQEPHKRYNLLTGEWILVSPQRNKRPWQGQKDLPLVQTNLSYEASCYLCPGNTRLGGQKNPNYSKTYSFVNDFAALLPTEKKQSYQKGLLKASSASGICKVLCFSPNHSLTIALMQQEQVEDIVQLWIQEFEELANLSGINYIQIFENKGALMGCSNPHPHGQIWAQHSIPNELLKKQKKQLEYYQQNQHGLLADYLNQELKMQERIVLQNDHFVALVPFWAVWPFETMIIPRRQQPTISTLSGSEQKAFADIIRRLTIRYDNLFQTSFPYSSGIHQAPCDGQKHPEWHFHMSFYPPLLRSASVKKHMVGYELFANPQRDITAEKAAALLAALPDEHYIRVAL